MRCLNCQNEFQGDYCPHCGQSAATRRFTIKNAFSSTLEVWGMGNRSLPRTLWHLFRRPGIMIGEYIDGKRIPFFPPVKMLFVLCVFYALLQPVMERRKDPVQKDIQTEINAHRQQTQAVGKDASEEDYDKLRAEVTRLRKELRQEKMRAEALDTMIDVAEEMFNIPVRKKAGTKQ